MCQLTCPPAHASCTSSVVWTLPACDRCMCVRDGYIILSVLNKSIPSTRILDKLLNYDDSNFSGVGRVGSRGKSPPIFLGIMHVSIEIACLSHTIFSLFPHWSPPLRNCFLRHCTFPGLKTHACMHANTIRSLNKKVNKCMVTGLRLTCM